MNAFKEASTVEAKSLLLLGSFLESIGNRYVLTGKGKLARHLQETCGDLLLNDRHDRLWGVELKAEERWTGNLFLETWSNRNLEDACSHSDHGGNPGWLYKSRSDLLFYHFLSADALYLVNLFELKRWAFRDLSKRYINGGAGKWSGYMNGRVYDFPETLQKKYEQRNDTWGRLVPLRVLDREMTKPPRRFSVQQLTLELMCEAA